jgi:aldose 1-epimerase
VGRTAFRIPYGRFELDGRSYQLDANGGPHHIHGGTKGFSWVVWDAEPLARDDGPAVRFTFHSPDGDQGYPGGVDAAVIYSLTNAGELRIEFTATCDCPTPVDMTHHGYFNLAGAGAGDVNDHVVQIAADRYSETDDQVIATGAFLPVEGTPYDFTEPRRIGERLGMLPEQLGGYDLAYLNRNRRGTIAQVASVHEPTTGRTMRVLTDAPALVFYGGNYLDGTLRGKGGVVYRKHSGLAMETAGLPDAVNHADFPSIILRPGETYRRTCIYRFTAE